MASIRGISERSDAASAVISNPYTRVCFRLSDQDARKLDSGFSYFDAKDLQSLGTGEAICRMERADYDFNLQTPLPPDVDRAEADQKRQRLVALSREKYAVPRANVEAKIESSARDVAKDGQRRSQDPKKRLRQESLRRSRLPLNRKRS